MSAPLFEWVGDGADKESGVATWTIDGHVHTLEFSTFKLAFAVANTLRAAYRAGGLDMQQAVIGRLQRALDSERA